MALGNKPEGQKNQNYPDQYNRDKGNFSPQNTGAKGQSYRNKGGDYRLVFLIGKGF